IYCHDPHIPVAEIDKSFYNARCTSCHAPEACTRSDTVQSELAPEAHRANDCITCHMRRQPPRDVEHTVTTDHWIRKPSTIVTPKDKGPTSPLVPLVEFTGKVDQAELGVAHVMYSVSGGNIANAAEGARLIRDVLQQSSNQTRLQCWLGFGLERQQR